MTIKFENRDIEDEDGYLIHFSDWSEALAGHLAQLENIQLEQNHWDVIGIIRQYYSENSFTPMLKMLFNLIAEAKQIEKTEASQLFYQLFPGGPTKQAFKIAGLPKPKSCV